MEQDPVKNSRGSYKINVVAQKKLYCHNLIHFKITLNFDFIDITAPGKENGSKSLKHVNLMNLTAIKRVVDITEASTDGIFALVCRTNQELKVCLFFRLCKAAGSFIRL